MATPLEQAKLLECILHELQLKDFNFGPKACRATQATQAPVEAAAGPAGHRSAQDHLLTPEPETWSETPSPSAASGAETWWTQSSQSTSASVESSPLLKPKQLCLDADKIQLPLAELLPTPNTLVMWRVMNPNAKFKASCGFPLVSHQLSNHLLEDFRVIFAAGNTWASQNKGKKQQASSKLLLLDSASSASPRHFFVSPGPCVTSTTKQWGTYNSISTWVPTNWDPFVPSLSVASRNCANCLWIGDDWWRRQTCR